MKRHKILQGIHTFLVDKGHTKNILEFLIEPQHIDDNEVKFRRSVVVTNVTNHDVFLNNVRRCGIVVLDSSYRFYQNADQILESDLIDLNDYSLENNWRGRILRNGIDFDPQTPPERLKGLLLDSLWRLIITKHDSHYFSKYNLHPVFYYPGDSVGGVDNFELGVNQFVEYVLKSKKLDPDFDQVVFFALNRHFEETGSSYLVLSPFGNERIRLANFLQRLRKNKEEAINALCNSYQRFWTK